MEFEFSLDVLSKNTQTSNSLKIRPVGVALFHADSRTDMTQLTVAFRNFAYLPQKSVNDVT